MSEKLPSPFVKRETDDTSDSEPSHPAGIPDRSDADPTSFPATVVSDADRIAASLEIGPLEMPIAACPGWDLRRLAVHTGSVHRWAAAAIRAGSPPPPGTVVTPSDEVDAIELGAWLRDGAGELADVLEDAEPGAPTWHPFPLDQRAWVWNRRMLIETMVHRWDAESSIGSTSTFRTDLAIVGLHEYLELGIRRVVLGADIAYPEPSLHIHCTDDDRADGAGEWLLRTAEGEYVLTTEHAKGDAAIRGSAEDILLVLTGRRDRSALDVVGDTAAADAWLDLPPW